MPPDATILRPRPAVEADAPAVAALHTASWRTAYRGSYTDAYLDGPIAAERDAFWRERLTTPGPDLVTLVLDGQGGALAGFVCGIVDQDPRWGSYVHNLHVAPQEKGRGLGRRLMRAFGEDLARRGATAPVHLFALASNAAARGFYERLGGVVTERLVEAEPDGGLHAVDRIAWPSLAAFLDGAA